MRMWIRAAILVGTYLLGGFPSVTMDPFVIPERRPNILLIVTDDQRFDTLDMMPHTRRWFGLGGTRFSEAFATTPLCCPARASLFTGLYAHNHGVVSNEEEPQVLAASEPLMVQRMLQHSGYRTGLFGKYLNNWPNDRDPANFDQWATTPFVTFGGDPWNVNGSIRVVDQNSTSFIGDQALDFLTGEGAKEQAPWFLSVTFMAPHMPATVEERYNEIPLPPLQVTAAMTERDRSDKPPFVQDRALRSIEQIDIKRAKQLRSLAAVDDQVNRIMERLKRSGELNDTLSIFLSDNGYQWGEHGLLLKSTPYMPSIRIPLFLLWPGHILAGRVDDRLVAGIDLAPTILSAVGDGTAGAFDGMDLLDPDARRSRLLLEFWKLPDYFVPSWTGLLTDEDVYVEYTDHTGSVSFREYYRLGRDPQQLVNVLHDGNPTNDPDVTSLSKALHQLAACAGSSCEG